jgi:hypothetical protein
MRPPQFEGTDVPLQRPVEPAEYSMHRRRRPVTGKQWEGTPEAAHGPPPVFPAFRAPVCGRLAGCERRLIVDSTTSRALSPSTRSASSTSPASIIRPATSTPFMNPRQALARSKIRAFRPEPHVAVDQAGHRRLQEVLADRRVDQQPDLFRLDPCGGNRLPRHPRSHLMDRQALVPEPALGDSRERLDGVGREFVPGRHLAKAILQLAACHGVGRHATPPIRLRRWRNASRPTVCRSRRLLGRGQRRRCAAAPVQHHVMKPCHETAGVGGLWGRGLS